MPTSGKSGLGFLLTRVGAALLAALRRLGKVGAFGTGLLSFARRRPVAAVFGASVPIIGLALAFLSYGEQRESAVGQSAAQATLVAIMGEQRDIQREILTLQSSQATNGPTATAAARRLAELTATQQALEVDKRRVEATLTAIALNTPRPAAGGAQPGAVAPQPTRPVSGLTGVNAQLLEVSRFQNTITVRGRYVNTTKAAQGQQSYQPGPTKGGYLLDEALHKRYEVSAESHPTGVTVPADGTLEFWAKYQVPATDKPQYLSVILGWGVSFDNVRVVERTAP